MPSLPSPPYPLVPSKTLLKTGLSHQMITPLPPVLVKPLLNPRCNQYCALPVEDPKLWAFYKRHITSFWTPEEINLSDDMKHHPNLPPDQLHFLSVVLSFFFAISDKIVANNLSQNFMTEVTSLEAQFFLWFSTHDGKHPQWNLLPPYWHIYQGQKEAEWNIQSNWNNAHCWHQSKMGWNVVQFTTCLICRMSCHLCCWWRHFFPSVPSSGLSNVVYSLAYVLWMSLSAMMKLFTVTLPLYFTTTYSNLLAISASGRLLTVPSKLKDAPCAKKGSHGYATR